MKPKPPLFRRPVPNTNNVKIDPKFLNGQSKLAQDIQKYGRDDISKRISAVAPILNLNRADYRKYLRLMKRKK
jgi:type II secretory pathway predicted ATPase ExeA